MPLERAAVDYLADMVSIEDIVAAIEKAGYGAVVMPADGQDAEDVEQQARQAEISDQTRKFIVGVIFAAPLFALSMLRDFGFLGPWSHAAWVNWLFLALATPVQFFYRLGLLCRRIKKPAQPQRQHGRADRPGLVGGLLLFSGWYYSYRRWGEHVYFETSAVIITLIKLGKLLEARTKGKTGSAISQTDRSSTQDRIYS